MPFFTKEIYFSTWKILTFLKKDEYCSSHYDQLFLLAGKLFIITFPTNCENQAASNSQIPDIMYSLLGRNS